MCLVCPPSPLAGPPGIAFFSFVHPPWFPLRAFFAACGPPLVLLFFLSSGDCRLIACGTLRDLLLWPSRCSRRILPLAVLLLRLQGACAVSTSPCAMLFLFRSFSRYFCVVSLLSSICFALPSVSAFFGRPVLGRRSAHASPAPVCRTLPARRIASGAGLGLVLESASFGPCPSAC